MLTSSKGNRKANKVKMVKKLPYDELKDKLLDNYNIKTKTNKTVLEDRFNMISNISKSTYL